MVGKHEGDWQRVPDDRQTYSCEQVHELQIRFDRDIVEGPRQVANGEGGKDSRQHFHSLSELHTSFLQLVKGCEERYDRNDEQETQDSETSTVKEDSRASGAVATSCVSITAVLLT